MFKDKNQIDIATYQKENMSRIFMNASYRLIRLFAFFAGPMIVFVSLGVSQTTTRPDRGFGGGGSFQSTDIDSISLQNGGVNLHIPLASLPPMSGGKLAYTLEATYNSKLWQVNHGETHHQGTLGCDKYPTVSVGGAEGAGWQIGAGYTVFFRQAWDDFGYYAISEQCEGNQTIYNAMILHRWFKPMLRSPDGSEHEMRIDGAFNTFPGDFNHDYLYGFYEWPGSDPFNPTFSSPVRFYTIDGTYLAVTYNPPTTTGIQWTLYSKDGMRVEQSPDGQRTWDTNGNSILLHNDANGSFIKDERTGRQVTWHSAAHTDHTDTIIQFQSEGGNWQTVTVHWGTTTVAGKTYTGVGWDPAGGQDGEGGPCLMPFQPIDGYQIVIRSIDFPSTEQGAAPRTYTFSYNSDTSSQVTSAGGRYCNGDIPDYTRSVSYGWGEVSEIVTPTNAHIKYSYGNDGTSDFSGFEVAAGQIDLSGLNGIAGDAVGSKQIEHDGTTDTRVYSGGGAVDPSFASGGQVTNPDGSNHLEIYYPFNPLYGTCCGPGTQTMQGRLVKSVESGRVLVERHWIALSSPDPIGSRNAVSGNPVVDTEYTTLLDAGGQTRLKMSAKKFTYDFNGDLKTTTEYDWFPNLNDVTYTNPGSPMFSYLRIPAGIPSNAQILRITTNSYHNSPDTSTNNYYYKRGTNPSSVIVGKVKETDISDGINAPKSTTLFCYDSDTSTSCAGEPTLGNLTRVRAWDSTRNAYLDTTSTYTPHGNVQSVTDPNENRTQFTYGTIGSATDLYPTQTVQAYGTSVARTTSADYDISTGLVTTATDVDNNVSTITVYDILGRPTKVRTAAGTALESWIQTDYSDYNRRIIVRSDQDMIGDGKHVSVQFYDQLGRVRLTKSLEDSAAQSATNETDGIKVETRYGYNDPTLSDSSDPQNTLGGYVLTSNPFRAATSAASGGETTMGWTLKYSARDGQHSEITSYSGAAAPTFGSSTNSTGTVSTDNYANEILVTDQANKQRISISNAVGQLKEVWEITPSDQWTQSVTFGATTSQGYKTSYDYDILNNLTTVVQGTQLQNRTFTYSSLSRLTSAFNPESGTTSYGYDPVGNLSQKIDARGVQTDYVYDQLNRVTHRNYSTPGGVPANYQASPNITFTYDDPNIAISKGKLTKVSTGAGAGTSTTEYLSFDILGRVTRSMQTTDDIEYGGGTDPNYWMTYSYNLAGALIEQQYPSGRTVKNILSNNGDLSVVESKKNHTGGYWHYGDSFSYSPGGAVTGMQLGNGHWESSSFNSRLQPEHINLGITPGATNILQLYYSYSTAQNNGDILSQTITVPTVVKDGNTYSGFVAVQNYTYDALNRIDDASETVSGVQTWRQDFEYDRNGNRTLNEINTTTIPRACGISPNLTICTSDQKKYNPGIDTTYNRLKTTDGFAFDSSGNTKTDSTGNTFIYDSEDKQVEVLNSNSQLIGEYWYDGDGKRIKKYAPPSQNDPGENTVFLYDLNGREIAEYSDTIASLTAKVSYLTNDSLGSPRIDTDAYGYVSARDDYFPFGEKAVSSQRIGHIEYSNDNLRKEFTGYEHDSETDLDFAQARMYKSTVGRFMTVDPIFLTLERIVDPQRINLYEYCRNQPLKFTDPYGLDTVIDAKNQADAEAKYELALKGLRKGDRQYVHLKVGDGKDGYIKGKFYITVDKDAKSDSKNFQSLQSISNDRERTTVISLVKTSDKYTLLLGVAEKGKVVLKEKEDHIGVVKLTDDPDDNGTTFDGSTLFAKPDQPVADVEYSRTQNNEVRVWSEQTEVEVVASIYHELRGHVFLSNNGRNPVNGIHRTKGVSTEARAAEDEARANFKQ